MKRMLLVAAVIALAACSRGETPATQQQMADTTKMADSMGMMADTTKMAGDTAKKM